MLIYLVAGARPNFMKIAPIVRALQARADAPAYKIIHTGQHYDREMSDVFFEELGIPKPDHHLGAGGGSHAQQTAKVKDFTPLRSENIGPDPLFPDFDLICEG